MHILSQMIFSLFVVPLDICSLCHIFFHSFSSSISSFLLSVNSCLSLLPSPLPPFLLFLLPQCLLPLFHISSFPSSLCYLLPCPLPPFFLSPFPKRMFPLFLSFFLAPIHLRPSPPFPFPNAPFVPPFPLLLSLPLPLVSFPLPPPLLP